MPPVRPLSHVSFLRTALLLAAVFLPLAAAAQESPTTAPQEPAAPAPVAQEAAPPAAEPLRVLWMGDIMMEVPWRRPPVSPAKLFDGVREGLAGRDLVIANLESALTQWPTVTPYKDKALIAAGKDVVSRTTSPRAAQALADARIQVVGLANNHTMDYTEHGLLDTFKQLNAAGVRYTGAGKNIAEAEDGLVMKIKGRRVGILSFSDVVPRYSWAEAAKPGIASAKEVERVVNAVRRARARVDLLIVLFHWGVQFDREPSPRQEFLAQETAKAGADLILGAHPHVLQGVGCLGTVPVVYSAGNFVFPVTGYYTRRGAIFEFDFPAQGGSPSIRLIPTMIDDLGAPQMADDDQRDEILADMAGLSQPLGLRLENGSGSCPAEGAPLPAPEKPKSGLPTSEP